MAVTPSPSDAFVVSPHSDVADLALNTPVFFEEANSGWAVGVLIGHGEGGIVSIRDPQRGVNVTLRNTESVIPVPLEFTKLKPEDFTELKSLEDLPSLDPLAREPATLFTLLHRMYSGQWEIPALKNPPLVTVFGGANQGILQEHIQGLTRTLIELPGDRCLLCMPAGSGESHAFSGRYAFQIPKQLMKIQPKEDVNLRRPVSHFHNALFTTIEALSTFSYPGRPSVSGMVYQMELQHDTDCSVRKVTVNPMAIDTSVVLDMLPAVKVDAVSRIPRSSYLAFYLLTESSLVGELGLPPQHTMTQLMPKPHFDGAIPTFPDFRGALDILGVGGVMGVQLWAILGSIVHILLARWVLVMSVDPSNDPRDFPMGVLSADDHLKYAAKCLQLPPESLHFLVQQQGVHEGMQLDYHATELSLCNLASYLYNQLVHGVFESISCYDTASEPLGQTTTIFNILPFEPKDAALPGLPCKRLLDREYMLDAVRKFYMHHAPDKTDHSEYLLSQMVTEANMKGFIAGLEAKYDRSGWFATREKIFGLYSEIRPELISSIDDILLQYHGREEELFQALHSKYNNGGPELEQPPLIDQLVSFFTRYDPGRVDESERLSQKWEIYPIELEEQLSHEYKTSFLQIRREAWGIYNKFSPAHLKYLDATMNSKEYVGKEEAFIESVRAKYSSWMDSSQETSYQDLFRLMRNSIFEVFHLLYMHHFYPTSETIETRQSIVELLVSTVAPSLIGSALDTLTTRMRPPGEVVSEIVSRFGGGNHPRIFSYGATSRAGDENLLVEHTLGPCSYNLSGAWAINAPPPPSFANSGNHLLRTITSVHKDGRSSYITKSVTKLTAAMALLATTTTPTSWVLSLDTHHVAGEGEVDIPTVLKQIKYFFLDLISGGVGQPVTPPRAEVSKEQQKIRDEAAKIVQKRRDELEDPLTVQGEVQQEDEKTNPMAIVAAATKIEQTEWTDRQQLENREKYMSNLVWLFHSEGHQRASYVTDENRKRFTIIRALRLRAAYTTLAENILYIERKEAYQRERIMMKFDIKRGLVKLQDLETATRKGIINDEKDERDERFHGIVKTLTKTLQRKEIRDSYIRCHGGTDKRYGGENQMPINRFLQLLEEDAQYRSIRPIPILQSSMTSNTLPHNMRSTSSAGGKMMFPENHFQQQQQQQPPPTNYRSTSSSNHPVHQNDSTLVEKREDPPIIEKPLDTPIMEKKTPLDTPVLAPHTDIKQEPAHLDTPAMPQQEYQSGSSEGSELLRMKEQSDDHSTKITIRLVPPATATSAPATAINAPRTGRVSPYRSRSPVKRIPTVTPPFPRTSSLARGSIGDQVSDYCINSQSENVLMNVSYSRIEPLQPPPPPPPTSDIRAEKEASSIAIDNCKAALKDARTEFDLIEKQEMNKIREVAHRRQNLERRTNIKKFNTPTEVPIASSGDYVLPQEPVPEVDKQFVEEVEFPNNRYSGDTGVWGIPQSPSISTPRGRPVHVAHHSHVDPSRSITPDSLRKWASMCFI